RPPRRDAASQRTPVGAAPCRAAPPARRISRRVCQTPRHVGWQPIDPLASLRRWGRGAPLRHFGTSTIVNVHVEVMALLVKIRPAPPGTDAKCNHFPADTDTTDSPVGGSSTSGRNRPPTIAWNARPTPTPPCELTPSRTLRSLRCSKNAELTVW